MMFEAGALHLFDQAIESSKQAVACIQKVTYPHLISGLISLELLELSGLMFRTLRLAHELMHLVSIFHLEVVFLSIIISSFLIINHPLDEGFLQEALSFF